MKFSEYQIKQREEKKKQAVELYKTGLTLRQVGQAIGRSHEWVAQVVKDPKNW